jgi:hypothetical protein
VALWIFMLEVGLGLWCLTPQIIISL